MCEIFDWCIEIREYLMKTNKKDFSKQQPSFLLIQGYWILSSRQFRESLFCG